MHDGAGVVIDRPLTAKEIHRLREDIIVDEASVAREETHQEDDVTTAEENVPDLIGGLLGSQFLLSCDHPESKHCHDQTMTQITEHDAEQEWESDDGVQSGISFLVRCDSICVDQVLEATSEFVCSIECWWSFNSFDDVQK